MITPVPEVRIDPINLEIAWRRLITVMDEVDAAVVRTSFSTIVGDGHDFACVLHDAKGYSIAESTDSSNLFTVMLPRTVRFMIEHFGEENIHEGDIFITNDPWLGSGHLPDVVVVSPVFYQGKLVAYIGTVAHVADIGGNVGYHNAATIYEEGLQIPPLKLYEAGTANEDLLRLIAQNVRVPDQVIGDIRAFISAHHVGQTRLFEFLDDFGSTDLTSLAQNIHYISEQAMRRALEEIPNGTYHCAVDADGFSSSLRIVTTLTVQDGEMKVDLEGSSPQVNEGSINCTLNTTLGDILIALKCSLIPTLPNNEGLFHPIEVSAPLGSIFNCLYPSAVKARSKTAVHTHEALYGALAQAIPDKVQAGSSSFWIFIASGINAEGKPFSAWLISRGGKGALQGNDGVSCVNFPSNGRGAPAEVLENHSPILIEAKEFNPNSAGPGEFRGGFGQRIVFATLSEKPVTITLRPNNIAYPPPGLLGGHPAVLGTYLVNGTMPPLAPFPLRRGDRIELRIPGSGGIGDPLLRDPALVLEDVRDELISLEQAQQEYGVVIDPKKIEVDVVATKALRARNPV